jgi:hypothetical protein
MVFFLHPQGVPVPQALREQPHVVNLVQQLHGIQKCVHSYLKEVANWKTYQPQVRGPLAVLPELRTFILDSKLRTLAALSGLPLLFKMAASPVVITTLLGVVILWQLKVLDRLKETVGVRYLNAQFELINHVWSQKTEEEFLKMFKNLCDVLIPGCTACVSELSLVLGAKP